MAEQIVDIIEANMPVSSDVVAVARSAGGAAGEAVGRKVVDESISSLVKTVNALNSRVDALAADGGGGDSGTELADARIWYDGRSSGTVGQAVRGQVAEMQERITRTADVVFEESWSPTEAATTYDHCVISVLEQDGAGWGKALIEQSVNEGYVAVYGVKPGFRYRIHGSSLYGAYNAALMAFVKGRDMPKTGVNRDVANGGWDAFGGNREPAWKEVTYEAVAPPEASWLLVRAQGQSTASVSERVYGKPRPDTGSIAFGTREVPVGKPDVTAGTVSSSKEVGRDPYRPVWMWELESPGELAISGIDVQAAGNEPCGLWVWVGFDACDYWSNLDGVFDLKVDGNVKKTYMPAYHFRPGWNMLDLGALGSGAHDISIAWSSVRSRYRLAVDTIAISYAPRVKPMVMICFDQCITGTGNVTNDERWSALSAHGMVATLSNPYEIPDPDMDKALAAGWDWALYGGASLSDPPLDYESSSVDDWERTLSTQISKAEEAGYYEPIAWFCGENRGSGVMGEAFKRLGIRIARIAGGSTKANTFWNGDDLWIETIGLGADVTPEDVLAKIDEAIRDGSSVCLFSHAVVDSDVAPDPMNITLTVFNAILDGIQRRVEDGECEIATFTDFYRKWLPDECAAKLDLRHTRTIRRIMAGGRQ